MKVVKQNKQTKKKSGALFSLGRVKISLKYLLQALLSAPNPDDPLANDVAELWKANEAEALKNARDCTRKYAMGN